MHYQIKCVAHCYGITEHCQYLKQTLTSRQHSGMEGIRESTFIWPSHSVLAKLYILIHR